jgi:adenylate cyclase
MEGQALPALSVVAYRIGLSRVAAETLGAYLGPQTGARVLQGMIRRGDSQVIRRHCCPPISADSRLSSTALRALKWSAGSIQHLECIGDAVMERGCEILN